MKARKAERNAAIGVFSASSPVSATVPVRYERGVQYLRSKGYSVVHGQLYGKNDHYRSGSIQKRAEEFNQLLYSDEIQIVMAAIGGNNTNSILPYIFTKNKQNKPSVREITPDRRLIVSCKGNSGCTAPPTQWVKIYVSSSWVVCTTATAPASANSP